MAASAPPLAKRSPVLPREDPRWAQTPFVGLLVFAGSSMFEFRVPEVEAVAAMLDVEMELDPSVDVRDTPFVRAVFPCVADAIDVVSRCVGVKMLLELWATAADWGTVEAAFAQRVAAARDNGSVCARWFGPDATFSFRMQTYGVKHKHAQQMAVFHRFIPVFEGKVQLDGPDATFVVCENRGRPVGRKGEARPVMDVWIGRKICNSARDLVTTYQLKKRPYLGTTSMAAELAFIMANQGHARPGTLVYDPFMGTGSVLLPAAVFGAHVMGADLDQRTFTGDNRKYLKSKNIWSNIDAYGLDAQWVDAVRMDNSNPSFRLSGPPLFDAIICDPPYGIREGARKVGPKGRKGTAPPPEQYRDTHIVQRVPYSAADIVRDMFDLASRSLVLGGRLVYWLPTSHDYEEEHVPTHPAFVVVSNSEQYLSYQFRRRLITMVKVAPHDDAMTASLHPILTVHAAERALEMAQAKPLTVAERKAEKKRRIANNLSRGSKRAKHLPSIRDQLQVQRDARAAALAAARPAARPAASPVSMFMPTPMTTSSTTSSTTNPPTNT